MARFNGELYRELMNARGLTERDVATHIGYSPALVHYFISGMRKPNLEQAVGMAQLVGCRLDDLIIVDGAV